MVTYANSIQRELSWRWVVYAVSLPRDLAKGELPARDFNAPSHLILGQKERVGLKEKDVTDEGV